ncbi:efflux RND transporter periplasmic adaptor subunit [Granulicella tundricola]|nr:efflux RND transporter periplasmic adaptor subunit [Granulicella tundricola]
MLAACSLVGSGLLCSCHSAPPPPTATDNPVVPVAAVKTENLSNEMVLTAEFIPYQDVDVMAKVSGYVRSIRVDIGDHVKQGDLLATLEVPELQDEQGKAAAGVSAAQANILTAQAAERRAKAQADIAHLSYQRILDVSKKEVGLVPRQEIDVAQSRDLEAAAQLASAQSAIQAAQENQTVATSERSRAGAMLQYATIRAPFSGVITKRYANTGSMIQAGISSQTQAMPVVRLAQNSVLRLMLPVPVSAVSLIHNGQAVDVNVTTLGRKFPGTVTRYADSLQTSTRTMETEVDVKNTDNTLVPGMYAEVHLHLADRPNALSVPLDAVDGLGTGAQQVWIVRDGQLHQVKVTTGIQTATRVEIVSGLQLGQQVVVGRHSGLTEGEKVEPHVAAYDQESISHS